MSVKTTLVTFVKDIYPHVKGDVLNIETTVLKAIADDFYVLGEKLTPTVDGVTPNVATPAQTAAEATLVASAPADTASKADTATTVPDATPAQT
jgi:hypothetical protein